MDAFFASVEIQRDPTLRGKPIAVGYDGPRGVVSTASYEARRWGVHSAMAIARARQMCPGLIIVPCHFELYKDVSARVHDIFHRYTDIIEPISLDEAFLDVTTNHRGISLAIEIAREIKQLIARETGLTASAGVSYCKFLAKIASDYRKPDGLTVVHPSRALGFIAALPVEKFWGIGPKTAERMHAMGIFTGAHLREHSLGELTTFFGKSGKIYHDFARGIDPRPVQPERERKSVGCEETFLEDIHETTEVNMALDDLISDLDRRLKKSAFSGLTLTLKVKYHDFTIISRSLTPGHPISTASHIRPLVPRLLAMTRISASRPVRLLGLSVSHPVTTTDATATSPRYPTLFDPDKLPSLR